MMLWRNFAACIGMDYEIFFPKSKARNSADQAKSICATCIVRTECLQAAMIEEQGARFFRYGVRGGMSAAERIHLAQRESAA